jgi:general secretion pathway protein C
MIDNSPMFARTFAFLIWALVAGAAMFWGLRLFVRPALAPASLVAINDSGGARSDLARLLGSEETPTIAAAAAPLESSRFKLIGVMAGKAVSQTTPNPGLALIAVDGKPPRAFSSGARVDEELVVQSLSLRTASIGPAQGPTSFVLEMPPPTAPATGMLAPAAGANIQQPAPQLVSPPASPPRAIEGRVTYSPNPEVAPAQDGQPAASAPVRTRRALVGGRNTEQ